MSAPLLVPDCEPDTAPAAEISPRSYWYVACQSHELGREAPRRAVILGEWLALFRDAEGRPVALSDRCMHRNAPLSKGRVENGCLQCPYHGWTYDAAGQVVRVPAEGPRFRPRARRATPVFAVLEQDGLIYVRLESAALPSELPYRNPRYHDPAFRTVRLENRFRNQVVNCAENYIDVPHTAYVHPKIFRDERGETIQATIVRTDGSVRVEYRGETSNLGWFHWFLNPEGAPIEHRDHFYVPNVTEVEYVFSPNRRLLIISQVVPEENGFCRVYTDLTYNFGWLGRAPLLGKLAARILAFQGQRVIDQDVVALDQQMEIIEKFGTEFHNTSADAIHVLVESLVGAIESGRDPRALPEKTARVTFWV